MSSQMAAKTSEFYRKPVSDLPAAGAVERVHLENSGLFPCRKKAKMEPPYRAAVIAVGMPPLVRETLFFFLAAGAGPVL